MADFGGKSDKKKRKTRAGSFGEKQRAEKKNRLRYEVKAVEAVDEVETGASQLGGVVEEVEEGRIWTNLKLILSLQSKNICTEKKVELLFDSVKTWDQNADDWDEAVSMSRLLVFLNDWIQSVLIPKGKGARDDGGSGMSMDIRCWGVFKFCLEEASRRHLSLNFSRNLLRAVVCALENALGLLNKITLSTIEVLALREEFEVHNVVLDCMSLVFSMHDGVLSDNLDMWLSVVDVVLKLVNKVFSDSGFPQEACDFSKKFSCLLLDYFSKYLRIHPCRKNGFQDFVDKLLEPLLHLCGHLHHQDDAGKLSKVVNEVLSQGLFHNVHVDGFLNFGSTEQYVVSCDVKPKEQKVNFKSYHRHLFGKIEKIIGEKKVSLFGGIGKLFHLLIQRIKIQRGVSSLMKDTHLTKDTSSDDASSSILSTEIRKSIFDVFAQIMEPLLLELSYYLDSQIEVGPVLLNIYGLLQCVNSIVNVLMQEKVYSITEDASEGACFEYLKKIHNVIMVFSTKVTHLWFLAYKIDVWNHMTTLIYEELILVVGHLLEIDYKVTGDELAKLWSMMFSFFSFGSGLGKSDLSSLRARALSFGCQLLNLYCELRQVNSVIVSLCEAMRGLGLHNYADDITNSLLCQLYVRSVRKLIGSQTFRSALYNAVKSIPEGQAGGFINQLAEDISDSLEWIKASCSAAAREDKKQLITRDFNTEYLCLHLEVFGVGLSEIYSLVLDSVSVTAGNSSLVGTSMEGIMAVLRPIMSTLVSQQPSFVDFLVSFTRAIPTSKIIGSESHLWSLRGPAHLILLFFFRLYLSCRSIYRQAISLVAPKISKKMSKLMGDPVSAYSGRELLEISDWTYEGYFSWILQPSVSLLTIFKFIQGGLLCDGATASPALTYVLHVMAIHRLVDLNRQLKTFEYLQQSTAYRLQSQMIVEVDLVSGCKTSSVESHMSVLRQETLELVDLMMGQLSLETEEHATTNDALTEVRPVKGWDLVICSLNCKSLPVAIWRILCQNIDIWSTHVDKKQLKIFLTELLCTSLNQSCELCCPEKVTIQKSSLELLKNTKLYEQKSVRRHLASRLCRALKKSMLALPNSSGNLYHDLCLSASTEILASLDNYLVIALSKKDESCELSSQAKHKSQLLTCKEFLDLLCWMPLGYLNRKSLSGLATTVLDLERLVIASVLETCRAPYEWLSLLVACRRALKHIVLAACEDVEARPFFLMTLDNSVATLWLLKTAYAMSQLSLTSPKDCTSKMRDSVFTLLDHTSIIFLNLCKNQVHHILASKKRCSTEAFVLDISHKMDCCGDNDAWRNIITMAKTLKEETEKLDISVSEIKGFNDNEAGDFLGGMNLCLNKLSCHLSCVHGFLWGLASALATKNSSIRPYEIKLEKETVSEVKVLSSMFADFLTRSLQYVLYEHSQRPGIVCPTEIKLSIDLLKSSGSQQETSEASNHTVISGIRGYSELDGNVLKQLLSEDDNYAAEIPIDAFQQGHFNRYLLRSLLRGDYPETAFLLRQLLLAASAGIRLNLHVDRMPTSSSSVPLFASISQFLLLELADLDESLPQFSFVWLDGVLKYLEELGNHFPVNKSNHTINDSYNKLIDLLLRVNGKCISFQGKRATLASHETESSTKMLDNQTVFSTTYHPVKPNMWDAFKCRLRTSFIGFIGKASEQHLLLAVHAIDRALVGVQEGSAMIYEVVTGSAYGGQVSSKVAAGVDCLDLVLEHASGRKRLGVVQRHIQRLVAGLFNITWHLQSPHIFAEQSNVKQESAGLDPDPGAVALMCTEVLTRIFAKQSLFRLDYCHVGQALRLPGALFQNFLHIKHTSVTCTYDTKEPALATPLCIVDRKFSIDLYAASCRLLSTVIKHHKDACGQSIAVLEDSVSVLLYCLETVNSDLATNSYFSWQVQVGVRCASFLRRVYEELRQQKDVFGHRVFLFLSQYIWVYSGYGPNKTGIKREIDEALKPGIYALIDTCSAADLQHLHTVFGEGPCRSTLARLQQDYESNFRFVGKV